MSLNGTPSGERVNIGIFGKRNAGKSSILNAITSQDLAVVSAVKGTTTDPVKKAMELLPLGPVLFVDTPGLDDEGELGLQRIKKAKEVLRKTQIAIVAIDASQSDLEEEDTLVLEKEIIKEAKKFGIDVFVCLNKIGDVVENSISNLRIKVGKDLAIDEKHLLCISAKEGLYIEELKEALSQVHLDQKDDYLIRDLLSPGDVVVLVVPIDGSAPKGRLILPQQQVIRDALDIGAIPMITRETELKKTLSSLETKPRMVVTDSQAFGQVAQIVPKNIPLTSFSILMARYKGDLHAQIQGARAIENLQDGDVVLVSEGCTHHRQCEDIGTVKMPRWIRDYTKKDISFAFTSGGEFPEDLSPYAMVVHCGGCTLNPKEMRYRIDRGVQNHVPITNYGVMIAYLHGILERVIEPFD